MEAEADSEAVRVSARSHSQLVSEHTSTVMRVVNNTTESSECNMFILVLHDCIPALPTTVVVTPQSLVLIVVTLRVAVCR